MAGACNKEQGNVAFKAGDYMGAAEHYTTFIRQHRAELADAYVNRANALHAAGKFQRSFEDSSAALAINPSHCKALHRCAMAHTGLASKHPKASCLLCLL